MDIVANAFVLFAAGFETVSTTMSFCLYELALKKRIQDRVREEMIATKSKYNGEVSSEFLTDLQYLEMVLAGQYFSLLHQKHLSLTFLTSITLVIFF